MSIESSNQYQSGMKVISPALNGGSKFLDRSPSATARARFWWTAFWLTTENGFPMS